MIHNFDLEHIWYEDLDIKFHLVKDAVFICNGINRSDYVRDDSYNKWSFMLFDFTDDW